MDEIIQMREDIDENKEGETRNSVLDEDKLRVRMNKFQIPNHVFTQS